MKGDQLRERLREYALTIISFYCSLPSRDETRIIGKQFLRSGTSAGAHYREAHRARSTAEFISKMEGGLQELDETDYWLDLLSAGKLIKSKSLNWLLRETDELIAIFTASVKTAKSRRNI